MNPKFVDHLVFRVADLDRTERFYTTVLGPPSHRTDDSVMYLAGETRLFFTRPEKPPQGAYDKESIGLNHMAFGVRGLDELQAVQALLDAGGVSHSGIKLDRYGSKEFIWLDDPDCMRLEFYLRPNEDS
jgi:catechol 2,3-dioxygenase-like lactoylglutathione lyase family enzyme